MDHPDYKRLGDDLILTKKISLIDALEQRPCTFRTLDGRTLTVALD